MRKLLPLTLLTMIAAACSSSGVANNDEPARIESNEAGPNDPPPWEEEPGESEEPGGGDAGSGQCAFRDPVGTASVAAGWSAMPSSTTVGVGPRIHHSAVWTGKEMIVFGGGAESGSDVVAGADGAAFYPSAATPHWKKLPSWPFSGGRIGHSAVWTGAQMVVWGGSDQLRGSILPRHTAVRNDGAAFDPCSGKWTMLAPSPLSPRHGAAAVWSTTTNEVLIVGGTGVGADGNAVGLRDAAAYNPKTNSWRMITTSGDDAPYAETSHAAAWDGRRMVMVSSPYVITYEPGIRLWDAYRAFDPAVTSGGFFDVHATGVTGNSVLVGAKPGSDVSSCDDDFMQVHHFAGNSASAMSLPTREMLPQQPRSASTTWFGGGRLYTFGGSGCISGGSGGDYLGDGAVLDLATNTWSAMPAWTLDYEGARRQATAVWTGSSAIIYGGFRYDPGPGLLADGAIFTP